jgi:hypothetical protein
MSPDDEYSAVIDQSAADAVRALLVVPHASPEGARRAAAGDQLAG